MKSAAYLGDTSLPGPASYLAGIMTHYGISYSHTPSSEKPGENVFASGNGLYILSDYPSANLSGCMERLCARVKDGAGLLMLGGWESYHGLGGDYDATPLAELLPVKMSSRDDRRNWHQTLLVRARAAHPILDGLPFDEPPCIGGYNEFAPKPGAQTLLEAEKCRLAIRDGKAEFSAGERVPLLVVSEAGGRRACLATDVAPHWVGGWVDWGLERLHIPVAGDFVEIGAWYAEFFARLVKWCLG